LQRKQQRKLEKRDPLSGSESDNPDSTTELVPLSEPLSEINPAAAETALTEKESQ
jgi:hypothetical protein